MFYKRGTCRENNCNYNLDFEIRKRLADYRFSGRYLGTHNKIENRNMNRNNTMITI